MTWKRIVQPAARPPGADGFHAPSDGRTRTATRSPARLTCSECPSRPKAHPDVLYYRKADRLDRSAASPNQGTAAPRWHDRPVVSVSPLPNWRRQPRRPTRLIRPVIRQARPVPAAPLDISGTHNSATHYHGSAAFPGIGSLRKPMGPHASNMPPPSACVRGRTRRSPVADRRAVQPAAIRCSTAPCGIERPRDLRPRPCRPTAVDERESDGRDRTNRHYGRRSRHRASDAPTRPGGSAMGTARASRLTASRPVARD